MILPRKIAPLDQDWFFHKGDIEGALPVGTPLTDWRWCLEPTGESNARRMTAVGLDTSGDDWHSGFPLDIDGNWTAWFRTEISGDTASRPAIAFDGLKQLVVLYVNGRRICRIEGRSQIFLAELDTFWKADEVNAIALFLKASGEDCGMGQIRFFDLDKLVVPKGSPVNPDYDHSDWESVEVPHDYVVEGPVTDNGADGYEREVGWYRRVIHISEPLGNKRRWLEFDGVYRQSRFWLNGKYVTIHNSGYVGCRVDVTNLLKQGENVVTVCVDPRRVEGWWYDGGGIYRHVRMVTVDPVHIVPDGVFVSSIVPDPKDGRTAPADVVVKTTLRSFTGQEVAVTIINEVVDADGRVIAGSEEIRMLCDGELNVEQSISMEEASLWSCEHPNLYSMRTIVRIGQQVVDRLNTTFGVRKVEFDSERGFLLNGNVVKIKGTCNHETHAGVGLAIPDRLHVWRLEQLKKMGGNAYRCAHNANSPILYEACDRMGILVMDEFRHFDDAYTMKVTENASLDNLDDFLNQVRRNRNHPSIILWSVCNEEGVVQNSPLGAGLAAVLRNLINTHDGTRLTTAAVNQWFMDTGTCASVDVVGFNYMSYEYDAAHVRFPHKPCIGTETSAEMATRGFYDRTRIPKGGHNAGPDIFGNVNVGWLSAYSENRCGWGEVSESAWKNVVERLWMSGYFVWTGFDYKGEPTPFSQPKQPSISSQFGILDTCGFPKDVYWYYRSWWGSEPVIHVFPHWNWQGREGETIDVWVHSNCETVELFLNGRSLGEKGMAINSHLEWEVAYVPGKLEARGRTTDGKVISDVVETTGEPDGIGLEPDRTELIADGQDLAWVGVSILDDNERVVATANNMVHFSVTGPARILGVGNGDPSCHEPDKAEKRSAFNGHCMVLVQTLRQAGNITLKAEADGLCSTSVKFESICIKNQPGRPLPNINIDTVHG